MGSEQHLAGVVAMVRLLVQVLNRYPLAGPVISAGVLSIFGDLVAQQAIENKGWRGHDWRRTMQLAVYGLCIIGPATCAWYRILDSYLMHPNNLVRTMHRVMLDQLLFTPIFLGVYFLYNSFCEGASLKAVHQKFRNGYFAALFANYKLWPAVQCITFYFVPLNLRLIFVNLVAIGWTAYLSNLNAKHVVREHKM